MFAVSRDNGPEITYTLEEVLRYAKSQGFYLNDQFEVVNDLFIYDDASTAKDQLVYWRAYDPNATLKEPVNTTSSTTGCCRIHLTFVSGSIIWMMRLCSLSTPTQEI